MKYSPLRISTLLALTFGSLVLIVLAVSLMSHLALHQAQHRFTRYVTEIGKRQQAANRILDTANARAIAARNLVLAEDVAGQQAERDRVLKSHEGIGQTFAVLRESLSVMPNVGDDERRLFAEMASIESRYAGVALRIVELATAGQRGSAVAQMNEQCRPLLAALLKATGAYIEHLHNIAQTEVSVAERSYEVQRNELMATSLAAVGLAACLALWITRRLSRVLGAEPAELCEVARRLAGGDLQPTEAAEGAPAGSVMASLGDMQGQFAAVVARVHRNSTLVAQASVEIAKGNADLSQRTDEQASALQQTASSMQQLGTTVRQNADNARQANQLAQGAATVAGQGGEVVAQVVSTMQGISESSRQIGDIIGVIDGIAFQTNILALNAAVEAARAGEQGRGFAVVAGEVRTLARRSADAAKEIKKLIGHNVEQVERGTVLVGRAGQTMKEIMQSIRRVSDIVGQITSATVEQSTGIGQVGDAVSQMDQVTQQNAALVEASAAAAESLKRQSHQLVDVVSVFKLGATGPASLA